MTTSDILCIAANGTEVRKGQVWMDLDKRMTDETSKRCGRVVDFQKGKVVLELVNFWNFRTIGHRVFKISPHRMKTTSTGWIQVLEAGKDPRSLG